MVEAQWLDPFLTPIEPVEACFGDISETDQGLDAQVVRLECLDHRRLEQAEPTRSGITWERCDDHTASSCLSASAVLRRCVLVLA
jgi:hypothetical protein